MALDHGGGTKRSVGGASGQLSLDRTRYVIAAQPTAHQHTHACCSSCNPHTPSCCLLQPSVTAPPNACTPALCVNAGAE
jgi:hypothetical protein